MIEYRFADKRFDQLPALAADLVRDWTAVTLGAVLATKLASAVDRSCIWANGALSVIGGLR